MFVRPATNAKAVSVRKTRLTPLLLSIVTFKTTKSALQTTHVFQEAVFHRIASLWILDKLALALTNVTQIPNNAKTESVLIILMGAVVLATMSVQAITATRVLAKWRVSVTIPLHLVVSSQVVLFSSALSSVSLFSCVKDDRQVKLFTAQCSEKF